MRTSTTSIPHGFSPLTISSTSRLTSTIKASRLSDSKSFTVRLLISSWKALRTTRVSCCAPAFSSKPTLRMYCEGSEMRQRTYQSITMRCFSAVSMGSESTLSNVNKRLSMKLTFWKGGGNLKFKPGSVITFLI